MTAENMLQNITPTGGGVIIAQYIYNPDGTRHYKRSHGNTGEQVHFYHAQYPFDDGALAQEILETANNASWNLQSNEVLRRYVRLPGSIDEAFLMIDYTAGNSDGGEEGKEVYVHFNRQGSVIATSDANGTVEDKYTYSPYGVSGTSNTGFPFRFTGQRLDPETGLYYYKARYYDAETGRFLQVDPIGYADQQNLYAYVGNDPVNASDPTGEIAFPLVYFAAVAVVSAVAFFTADDVVEAAIGRDDGTIFGDTVLNGVSDQSGTVPDKIYDRKAPGQRTPAGGETINHGRYNPRTGEYEESEVEYDEYGRQKRRTDKTDPGRPT